MMFGLAAQAEAAPLQFVYKGAGCTGAAAMSQFETFLGRKADGVVDFDDQTSWSGFDSASAWSFGCWKGKGYKLAYSLPLTVNGTPLATVASGAEDSHFKKLAQGLVANGFADAYIRVGWEFNGGWYPWAANGQQATFIAAFRHVVSVLRSVPGQSFKIVWNPALYEGQFWPDQAYPGDDVVDIIATDAYNQSWDPGYTNPYVMWNSVLNDSWGVAQVISYAAQHKKPVAFPEWGTGIRPDGHGGGDDPNYINNMAAIMATASDNVVMQGYWDYAAPDYNALISTGQYPNAAKAFQSKFKTTVLPGGSGGTQAKVNSVLSSQSATKSTSPAPTQTTTTPVPTTTPTTKTTTPVVTVATTSKATTTKVATTTPVTTTAKAPTPTTVAKTTTTAPVTTATTKVATATSKVATPVVTTLKPQTVAALTTAMSRLSLLSLH